MNWHQVMEIVATVSGILCVYLQTREKIIAWPFGILSVTLSAIIFHHSRLYSDLILHVVYIFLNIYGWWHWSVKRSSDTGIAPVRLLKNTEYALWTIVIVAGTTALGTAMSAWTDADLPYFDAFTTTGSLVAQFLLARKILQNWLLWIIVDIVAINVYLYKGLYYFAFLFFVYLLLCIKGYRDWRHGLERG